LLTSVSAVAAQVGIPFFTVGAMARDLVLWYGFGVKPGRATKDVDLAFSVSSWVEYDRLRAAIEGTGSFEPDGKKQRMRFKGAMPVDILPFGEIVDETKKVTWRPDGDSELNLQGFDEAYSHAMTVRIRSDPVVEVRIATAAGLVLLKIFAWDDRRPGNKDAIDLGILIRSYMQVGNDARLWEEHKDLLDHEDFDYELAGARILGRDLSAMCEPETRQAVLAILDRELSSEGDLPLVVQSAASSPQIDRTREFWQAIRQELANVEAA
jgi:predicted nucleotidyltransferase